MPRQEIRLVNNEIYHVVLRSVGDTVIFKEEKDFYRGIFSIYEFNDKNFVEIRKRRQERKQEKISGSPRAADRDLLVNILVFCFMPNHIHLLLQQLKGNGISQFMQKIGGYASYFNKKYGRKGHLFNQFKAVHILTDDQLKSVFTYIHCNPISLIDPGWKDNGVENVEKTITFLENYKWNSYQDYIGKPNFPSVIKKDFILTFFGGEQSCKNAVEDWIRYKKEIKEFGKIILE